MASCLCLNFTGDFLPLSLRLLAVTTSGVYQLFSGTSFVNWDSFVMRRCCFVYLLYFVCHRPHMVPPLGGPVLCLVCIVLTPASGSSFTFSHKLFNRSSSFIFAIYVFISSPARHISCFLWTLGSATFPNSLPGVPRTMVCPILEPHLVNEDLQSLWWWLYALLSSRSIKHFLDAGVSAVYAETIYWLYHFLRLQYGLDSHFPFYVS